MIPDYVLLYYCNNKEIDMRILNKSIKWIMIVSGALTCTMVMASIAPETALNSTFGSTVKGPLAELIVRNWGALITLIGALLIYGAFSPIHRRIALIMASISKTVFIALVLTIGSQFLDKAWMAIAFDSVFVLIFAIYLIFSRKDSQ